MGGGVDTLLFRDTAGRRLFLMIAMATVPVLVVGGFLAISGLIDALRSPYIIAATSIGFGILLWFADRAPQTKEGLARISWREAMIIGGAQMLSPIPGTSRSGITMTAARFLGWTREEAARFSMLLAIPTILAGGSFAALELIKDGAEAQIEAALIVGVLSMLAAFASIAVLMRLTRKISFTPFVIYRLLFGALLLIFSSKLS